MRYLTCLLLFAATLALSACGSGGSSSTGVGVINLNGGNGGSSAGGNGGTIISLKNYSAARVAVMKNFSSAVMGNFSSAVHGDLKFLSSGSVNAGFSVPGINPAFGDLSTATTVARTVTAPKTVLASPSTTPGDYYVLPNDPNLYFVSGSGTAKIVTGLTVNAKLTFPSHNVPTVISGGIVINNTVSSNGVDLDLQSGTFLQINGTVTSISATAGAPGGRISLSSGGTFINQGTVEASGSDGTAGGNSGGVVLHALTFLYNTGTVNAKGGKGTAGAGGAGGDIRLLADQASVATSNLVDSSGGNGTTGGNAGAITLSGGGANSIGRVYLGGTVNGNGGSGSAGNGGVGARIVSNSFSGGILFNATTNANGGASTAGGNGGDGGSLRLNNDVSSSIPAQHQVSPEGVQVTGNISLAGGDGAVQGGSGGAISVASGVVDDALQGFANVQFFGYKTITMNGGSGGTGGAGGAGGSILAAVESPPSIVGVAIPAGGVYNEVNILAVGGANNAKSAGGGKGGNVLFVTPQAVGTTDPLRTLVTNSGGITVSGGAGDNGGMGGNVAMRGYGNVTNSGGIVAQGGTGTITGGDGSAEVRLLSSSNVSNSGGINVAGGDGATGGKGGSVSIISGNQTTASGGIGAYGGSSTNGGNGGNGGTITLFSEYALTNRSSLTVARGSGGSSNTAVNGTIFIDGTQAATALPNSGAI